jgi:hypothetical protein
MTKLYQLESGLCGDFLKVFCIFATTIKLYEKNHKGEIGAQIV